MQVISPDNIECSFLSQRKYMFLSNCTSQLLPAYAPSDSLPAKTGSDWLKTRMREFQYHTYPSRLGSHNEKNGMYVTSSSTMKIAAKNGTR